MRPLLYNNHTRQATWLELFFDLVFVAVIGAINHDLAHTHNGIISSEQLLRLPLVFIPVWWIWATHTVYANRFDNDDRFHRFCALIIMALLVVLATYEEGSHGHDFLHFNIIYVVIRVLLAGLYLRIHSKCKETVHFAKETSISILIGAAITGSAIFAEGNIKFTLFYSGIIADMVLQIRLHQKTKKLPVDRKHLVERIGLLAIIILGESVISIISSLSDQSSWDIYDIIATISGFTMIWAIWWIYYDSFHNLERAKKIKDGNILVFTHLFLCMGLIILATLIGHSIKCDLDQTTFRMLAITGMCCFYLGKQIIYFVCFPPFGNMIIINT
ncbi:MAG: low temperature requirement protein A, partial [Pseudomonadota bacterium]